MQNPATDVELIQQCRHGQTIAFRALYRRYHSRVRGTLHQLCGAAALDDLEQEVFVRVWKGLPKFQQSSQFSTWLYRITWNVATDCRRAQGQQRSRLAQLSISPTSHDPADWQRLHYEDLVQRGLQSLSLEHRGVIVLHDLEDLPQADVAKILKLPLGTVKSRLHHARAALRTFLQNEGVHL